MVYRTTHGFMSGFFNESNKMILRNHCLSAVSLFRTIKPFTIPFTRYQYFSGVWQLDCYHSGMWKSGFPNNRSRRMNITSCHWGKNI